MFIIFGTKVTGRTIQKGQFACPNCNCVRDYEFKKYQKYFSLFFIPLIPLNNLGERLICTACHTNYLPGNFFSQNDSASADALASPQAQR